MGLLGDHKEVQEEQEEGENRFSISGLFPLKLSFLLYLLSSLSILLFVRSRWSLHRLELVFIPWG